MRAQPILAMFVALFASRPATTHAAPGDATRLEYARSARAARCPNRDALKSAVSRRLGYDPFFPAARQTIVVEITDAADGLRARMHLIDENGIIVGSRELHDNLEHCDELVASLALAISIALDPSAALGAAPQAVPEEAKPATSPDPGSDAEEGSAPSAATSEPPPLKPLQPKVTGANGTGRARSRPLLVRGAGFSGLGVAPSLAFGFRAGASLRWDWFELTAEFADQFPATRTASGGGSARASLYEGSLTPCYQHGVLAGCALLAVGSLQSQGRDIPDPVKKSSAYLALGARLELTPQLIGHLRLLLNTDARKSLTPIALRLRGEEVWQTPFVSLAVGVGLALQF